MKKIEGKTSCELHGEYKWFSIYPRDNVFGRLDSISSNCELIEFTNNVYKAITTCPTCGRKNVELISSMTEE